MIHPTRIKVIPGKGFQVMCQIQHPMENGSVSDQQSGRAKDANYITRLEFRLNDEVQAEMLLGPHVSANPVLGTYFAIIGKGDTVSVSWQDMAGNSGNASQILS